MESSGCSTSSSESNTLGRFPIRFGALMLEFGDTALHLPRESARCTSAE